MALSATEQYLLELINRARLDPVGEAARFGVSLNTGLSAGQLGTQARQVLAPNELLETAAINHSKWMIATDNFTHTQTSGSTPASRATAQGYSWSNIAENIAWRGTTASINFETAIAQQHKDLFLSPGHRVNMLGEAYREVGLAQEGGRFVYSGNDFDSSMVTELFGKTGTKVYLTGVAYTDTNDNNFYSVGEGRSGVSFTSQAKTTDTGTAGGYALALTAGAAVSVAGTVGNTNFSATVDMTAGNVKLDIVDGNRFYTSGDITLGAGINRVTLLGTANLEASGNSSANSILGNAGANIISGNSGSDLLAGGGGNDLIYGGYGNDTLQGNSGHDKLSGGVGSDRLHGGYGNDQLTGGSEADTFIFMNGCGDDRIVDFSVAGKEALVFDNAIWGGATMTASQVVSRFATVVEGNVVFEFSPTESVTLSGVGSTAGLSGLIQLI